MIYVDEILKYSTKYPFNNGSCHMMVGSSDDIEELHAFAVQLGLTRAWFFQNKPRFPHYALTPGLRIKALLLGAISVDTGEIVRKCARDAI